MHFFFYSTHLLDPALFFYPTSQRPELLPADASNEVAEASQQVREGEEETEKV